MDAILIVIIRQHKYETATDTLTHMQFDRRR